MNGAPDIPKDGDHLAGAAFELDRINAELAALFGREPIKLAGGADESRRDPLVICGLLGGKDVGKSTLVNTLAQKEISIDRDEVGAGTSRPIVYVHHDMVPPARMRLGRVDGGLDLQVSTHSADGIRNIVLVDLPDFDSDFMRHEAIVKAVVPHLDRVIWVATPRKIADRAWVAFAQDVVKDDTNVYFVLNKCDELLADEEDWTRPSDAAGIERQAEMFCNRQRQWALRMLAEAGHEMNPDRVFLLAVKFAESSAFLERVGVIWDDPGWHRYGGDRPVVTAIGRFLENEVKRLRRNVLGPLGADEAAEVKERNLREQIRRNTQRIRQAYEIDHWLEQLQRATAGEHRQAMLNDAFGADYCRGVATALWRTRRSDIELADEVMDVRAGRWPLLRVAYWLSRWVIRRVGRTLAGPGTAAPQTAVPAEELFRFRSRGLADRLEALGERLRTEHSPIVRQFQLRERFPDTAELAARVEQELAELPLKDDESIINRLTIGYRPSWAKRLFVWCVLFWFPFVQPVAEGLLEMAAAGTRIMGWAHGLYRLVWALGATQLLKGFVVVVGIYVACLAAIYARSVQDVYRARGLLREGGRGRAEHLDARSGTEMLAEAIDRHLLEEVGGAMFRPFEAAAIRLGQVAERLHRLDTPTPALHATTPGNEERRMQN
ncbi:MAG TPA: GTPase domain-containing protein [Phycisphaerae bacterium]|nr:GTPase domain-containing protein [Phycisphaerae bacterium]HRR83499.1 GTPase domain-containing protein [Phycisphaerae bacterium]